MIMSSWKVSESKQSMPTRGLQSSSTIWMKQKSQADTKLWGNDPNLWVVENKVYDLTGYIDKHPGGKEWLKYTKGQDITQHFVTHHLNQEKARAVLEKYLVGPSKIKIQPRYTFEQTGLFRAVKKRVLEKYSIAQLSKTSESELVGIIFVLLWALFFVLSAIYESYILAAVCGWMIFPLTGVAHNFVHMKPHFYRNFYQFTGFTYEQWQRMHCLSHHSYPNTLLDYEFQALQPMIYYLKVSPPNKAICGLIKQLFFFIIAPANIILKLIIVPILQKKSPQWLYLQPLMQIPLLYAFTNDWGVALKLFFVMHMTFGVVFAKLSFIGHRTGKQWSQGNLQIRDFAHHQVASSTDIKTSLQTGFFSYLFYSGFNTHAVHHFFPTVDNYRLPQINAILNEECAKRNIKRNLVSGIFEGLLSVEQNFYNRKQWTPKKQ